MVGIDSGDPNDKVHTAKGFISPGLANALTKRLKADTAKVRIAMVHHHPLTWKKWFSGLEGRDYLIRALAGRCDVLLFGHHHEVGIFHDIDGIPLMCASHKSTHYLSGECLMYGLLTVRTAPNAPSKTSYRMVVAQ